MGALASDEGPGLEDLEFQRAPVGREHDVGRGRKQARCVRDAVAENMRGRDGA
jgi:hypothetical protein